MGNQSRRWWVTLAAAGLLAASGAAAQSFPAKTVRVVVPNAAGGPSDLVGRVLAQKLAEVWGQPVVVENRVGAGGNIGVDAVVKSAPDGYTLLVTNSAPIVVNKSLYASVPYDPVRDLTPVSLLASAAQLVLVPASLGVNSVAELIRMAKAQPGKLTFASLGSGTAPHLNGEMLKTQAGIDMLHVPYRSTPQAEAALITGEVSLLFGPPNMTAQVQAGKLKLLAVSSRTRAALHPQTPTLAESGLPDFDMIAWYGMLAPAGMPRDVLGKVHADTARVMNLPDIKAKMAGIGFEVVANTPEQFAAHIQSEIARWAAVVKSAGLKVN